MTFEHSGLLLQWWDQDSVVSIVTCYRLEDLGIESWWGRDILHLSRPALGPTQPPVHWYWVSCLGVKQLGSIEEEIQHWITLGNKAYYTKQCFFKSRLVCKKSKLKLYCSIIRPAVTYGCETWVWKGTIKIQGNGIWKESIKKDFWSYKRKRWYMENQNKRWINKT